MNSYFTMDHLKRISIFVGAYGSGKSEISVNFARWLHADGQKTVLCDLDIINPYYRSADARDKLEQENIRVIASQFAGTNVDVPSVPGEIFAAIDDKSYFSVLDIGGEDLGARVLASMKNKLAAARDEIGIYMVVNTCRPYTADEKQIALVAAGLAYAADISLDGLVHNSNLMDNRSDKILEDSWPIIKKAAASLGIPVVFAAGKDESLPDDWLGKTAYGIPLLRLGSYINYPD